MPLFPGNLKCYLPTDFFLTVLWPTDNSINWIFKKIVSPFRLLYYLSPSPVGLIIQMAASTGVPKIIITPFYFHPDSTPDLVIEGPHIFNFLSTCWQSGIYQMHFIVSCQLRLYGFCKEKNNQMFLSCLYTRKKKKNIPSEFTKIWFRLLICLSIYLSTPKVSHLSRNPFNP